MFIEENWINRTEGYRIGDSGIYEPYTDNLKTLFQYYQREYGRCVSSVYVDTIEGKAKKIGWVFEQKARYEDTGEFYIRETWVTLHEKMPERKTTYHYLNMR